MTDSIKKLSIFTVIAIILSLIPEVAFSQNQNQLSANPHDLTIEAGSSGVPIAQIEPEG